MPRMKILNSVEREAFELPPMFNSVERKRNFDFPVVIEQIAAGLRTPINQLCFLVNCGLCIPKIQSSLQTLALTRTRPVDFQINTQHGGSIMNAMVVNGKC